MLMRLGERIPLRYQSLSLRWLADLLIFIALALNHLVLIQLSKILSHLARNRNLRNCLRTSFLKARLYVQMGAL